LEGEGGECVPVGLIGAIRLRADSICFFADVQTAFSELDRFARRFQLLVFQSASDCFDRRFNRAAFFRAPARPGGFQIATAFRQPVRSFDALFSARPRDSAVLGRLLRASRFCRRPTASASRLLLGAIFLAALAQFGDLCLLSPVAAVAWGVIGAAWLRYRDIGSVPRRLKGSLANSCLADS